MSRSNGLIRMFFAVVLGRGVLALRQLMTVPLMLAFWGADVFGEWLMLSSIPTFVAVSNLGLGTAAAVQTGISVANSDYCRAEHILSVATFWLTVICGIGSALALTLVFMPIQMGFANIDHAGKILGLLILVLLLRIWVAPLRGIWVGLGYASNCNHWFNLVSFLELISIVLVVSNGLRPLELAACLFGINVAWAITYVGKSIALMRSVNVAFLARKDLGVAKTLLFSGFGHQLSPLWQSIYYQGMVLVAGLTLGPNFAALWGAVRALSRVGNQGLELVSQSLSPEFQRNFGVGDKDELTKLYSFGIVAGLAVSLIAGITLLVFGEEVFSLWTGGKFTFPLFAWGLLICGLMPHAVWLVSAELHIAIDRPWKVNIAATVMSFVSLSVAYLSMSTLKITALAIATILFDVTLALVLFVNASKIVDSGFISTLKLGVNQVSAQASSASKLVMKWGQTRS